MVNQCCGVAHCAKDLFLSLRNTSKAIKCLAEGIIFQEEELKSIFSSETFATDFEYPKPHVYDSARYLGNSLCYHSQLALRARQQTVSPTAREMELLLDTVEKAYRKSRVIWHGFHRVDEELMADFIQLIDRSSSPGFPWKEEAASNEQLFDLDANHLPHNTSNVLRVMSAVNTRLEKLENGIAEADNINVFIKQEPHKMKKVELGAWRLIQGVGLTDSLIDRLLFGHWFSALIEQNRSIPSKPGWTPIHGGFRWLAKKFRTPMMADKSGWDWTVQEWHVEFLKKFIPRMIIGIPEMVVSARLEALFRVNKWQLGDAIIKQNLTGIQKSGCLGTIAFNSIWQYASHVLASQRLGWDVNQLGEFACLGDDTIQEVVPDVQAYEDEIAKTGAIVKQSEVSEGKNPLCEFAGFLFDQDKCHPAYRAKHAFALYHCSDDRADEMIGSYLLNYGMDSNVADFLRRKLFQRGCPDLATSSPALHNFWTGYEQALAGA